MMLACECQQLLIRNIRNIHFIDASNPVMLPEQQTERKTTMSQLVHPLTQAPSLRFSSPLTSLKTAALRGYAAFTVWQQQRQLLRDLESMPIAMRKDLGWPAINTKQDAATTRR
jgi:hypothetical protein